MRTPFYRGSVLTLTLTALLAFLLCACTAQADKQQTALSTTAPLSDETTLPAAQENAARPVAEINAYINLNDAKTTIKGIGAAFSNNTLTVTQPGVYSLKGTLSDGRILVNTGAATGKVKLVFNGVDIQCSAGAPLYVENAAKQVKLVLTADAVNTLFARSGGVNTETENAALVSKSNLEIEGSGTLNVNADLNDGIFCAAHLTVAGGTLNVNVPGSAIRSNQGVRVAGGSLVLACGETGIRTKAGLSLTGGSLIVCGEKTPTQFDGARLNFRGSFAAGANIRVLDEANRELAALTPARACKNILIVTPDLQTGTRCTVTADGKEVAAAIAQEAT